MYYIVQGQNTPISITFSSTTSWSKDIIDISVALFDDDGKEIKLWTKDNIILNDTGFDLPLTQKETISFPECKHALLESKWNYNEDVKFGADVTFKIINRYNKSILKES